MVAERKLLITGANGWLGSHLMARNVEQGQQVHGTVRSLGTVLPNTSLSEVSSLDGLTDWRGVLVGCQTVVHTAARVHIMRDDSVNPLAEYRRTNVEGSLNLATQAAHAGVKRFVFISSIKVNGEKTQLGHAFNADDVPAPQDPYGISKMEAEAGLRAIAQKTGMEVVIIRPPLIYGPGVKANFASMVRWLQHGVPLPLGAIHNRRSLVALDNLTDLIIVCTRHPAAANQTFLVSDGEDISTSQLLRRMARALGKPARLLPVPQSVLNWGAVLVGRQDMAQRLLSSLQVDMEKTRRLLGWAPPLSLEQGLLQVAQSVKS